MQQFSIKNERAVALLNTLTERTGKGKTEVVLEALEQYDRKLRYDPDTERLIKWIEENIHPTVKPEYLGKAPTKEEIEAELGMP